MNAYNIILAGVGGQGLVLSTKIICEAGLKAGYDVKSNDVVGLSQRGGKVWGNVRLADKVYSPDIPKGKCDFLLGFEPLEALRMSDNMKKEGFIIYNNSIIPPALVIAEKEEYPEDIQKQLNEFATAIEVDANEKGVELGSVKVANTILLGVMAKKMDISLEIWKKVIKENVPGKFTEMNLKAFEIGYNYR
jgi:indolepyruvate ferredoxin oxidoreductase beta subunit